MIDILLEEEFGYRYFLWQFNGTKDELISEWKNGNAPLELFKSSHDKHPPKGNFRGELKKLSLEDVEIHHWNKKYNDLWLVSGDWERGKTKEYKELESQYKNDLNNKWPIRCHVFDKDNTWLIVDGVKYTPDKYK